MVALVWFRRDLRSGSAGTSACTTIRRSRIGKDYPGPIVDHKRARQAALDRYRDPAATGS